MSEIELLYKNAGVEPTIIETSAGWCPDKWADYPLFTPEKQLELIKWLARFNLRIEYTNAKYYIESHYHGYSVYIECFEQALAGLINNLWQDLTEQERTEIADILRG